jgi:hypothetical protein
MFQMGAMIILNTLHLDKILGAFGWRSTLFTNVSLNIGSITFYTVERLFEGAIPPELYYWWN